MLPVARLVGVGVSAATRPGSQRPATVAREVAHRAEAVEEVKKTTGHVLPSYSIVHVGPNTHIFNGSDANAYVEVTDAGEVRVKPVKFGRIIIGFTDPDGE